MAKVLKPKSFVTASSLRKLKTHFEDELLYFGMHSAVSEIRHRVFDLDFKVLREMARRLSPASMIINCREQQITPFLFPAREVGQPGFCIHKKGKMDRRFKTRDKRSEELTEMFSNTGFVEDARREDDFIDFGKMMLREILTIDQICVELQRNRRGEVGAFWLVDGATISRCTEKGYEQNSKLVYVQEVRGQVLAAYTREDLVFDCMFKRVDIEHRGYGYSLLEQAVDLVTTLILGVSHSRDSFTRDRVPKGFIALQGDADRVTIDAVERYWYRAMSGLGARFSIPIVPSGKDGVAIDFKTLGNSNKDMEYRQLMYFFLSLFAAVFCIDLAELGLKTDLTQPMIGENISKRQEYSKDRGLAGILFFMKGVMNKILNYIDPVYEFSFVGLNPEDESLKYDIATKAIGSLRTINELREEEGLEPKDGEEYNMVLNPTLVQAKGQMAMGGGGEEEEGEYGEYEEEEGEEESGEEEYEEGEADRTSEEYGESKPPVRDRESPATPTGSSSVEKALEEHLEELSKAGYDIGNLL